MEGRRRLVLLAVIIVAVAIGAVGVTLMSLFDASLEQQRQILSERLADSEGAARGEQRIRALTAAAGAGWRVSAAGLPDPVVVALAAPQLADVPAGETRWHVDAEASYLVGLYVLTPGHARVAWLPLDELRAPYHRAALQAGVGLVVLLALGLILFYRTTTPLLRSLAASEARYRTLFSSTAEGVLLLSERVEECNERVCDMFHCRREEVIGLPWREFFRRYGGAGERLPVFEGRVMEALRGNGGPFTWEFNRAGASPLVVEIALRRLEHAGDGSQLLASLRDVSYREEASRALREAERSLRESRERIARAGRSSALIELAAGIAHEVNQPLAAIANYARASRRLVVPGERCPPDVAGALDRIAEQAQRAGDAIHRIRALVSVAPGSSSHRTCLNQLVREVVALMNEEIEAAGATVHLSLDEDLIPVLADTLQIQQVMVQLLRNALEAVEHMPADRRHVRVCSRRVDDEVEVEITDQGRGIPEDDQLRLFEPFFSTREGGMGMGLAISLSIIRAHMGELEFDPGHVGGACFRFRLPADVQQEEGSAVPCRDKVAP